ncbi:MAG: topoisomerase DNA-binding C4 zinc finger domain-containing protein [Oscillospiraceae bacterium]|nr:topoisomerase DNA-binding C4 zinc finger domain-containing protein [Oscillospiraceae bacterium]
MEGERIKVPDEVTDEKCDVCGANMVIKTGRFGRFLACPNYPECTFTKPLVIEMPGSCPRCGGRILKRTSRKGYTFYACERGQECGFMSWEVPTAENCPSCGKTLFKRSGKGKRRPFCINPECPDFLPEDKRGYHRKASADKPDVGTPPEGETAAKKPVVTKKPAAAKKPATAKKPASAKKPAPAVKKPAAKKVAKTK